MRITKRIDSAQLQAELQAAGLTVSGLATYRRLDGDTELLTYNGQGELIDIPTPVIATVQTVVAAHVPPPDDIAQQIALAQRIQKARADTAAATTLLQMRAALLDFEDATMGILKRLGQKVS